MATILSADAESVVRESEVNESVPDESATCSVAVSTLSCATTLRAFKFSKPKIARIESVFFIFL